MFDLPASIASCGQSPDMRGHRMHRRRLSELEGDKIKAVAPLRTCPRAASTWWKWRDDPPRLFQSHGHLAWDGIHDLAWQSMYDSPEIAAYKSAGNMLIAIDQDSRRSVIWREQSQPHGQTGVEQGIFPGPRLYITGEAIVQTAAHLLGMREASGPSEMRRACAIKFAAGGPHQDHGLP